MNTSTLVLVLHGFAKGPADFTHVESTIKRVMPSARVVIPKLPLTKTSLKDPIDVVADLLHLVDALYEEMPFQTLILVGHSMGGVLARQLYVAACGNHERAPLHPTLRNDCANPRVWSGTVERLVLMAGMNSGWTIDYHMRLSRIAEFSLGVLFGRLVHFFLGRWPSIFSLRRGAPFLTQLRVQWIWLRRNTDQGGIGSAPVIQLLGTVDDIVSPQDNVDLVTGQDFYYIDVPMSGHRNVIVMDDSKEGRVRAECFQVALAAPIAEISEIAVPMFEDNPIIPRLEVQEVVFVVHGIRDEGFWTQKIARDVIKEGRKSGRVFAHEASTYGYLGMLPFLSPWKRRQKVEWLMNKYTESLLRYPNAKKFHYVGHSNGTYLVAKAIEKYPCCQFSRVVFAGSVVRSTFDWERYIKSSPAQVDEVLNYAATSDWVVACFPNCFEYLGLKDLGGAGHRGFADGNGTTTEHLPVTNIEYVVGSHAAAIVEGNWGSIAKFVVHGHIPGSPLCGAPTGKKHSFVVGALGRFPPLAWLLVIALVVLIPFFLLAGVQHYHWMEWWIPTTLIAYIAGVIYIGNRV
jgi:pimeloyl-ACP methyl ester carboxylesterase